MGYGRMPLAALLVGCLVAVGLAGGPAAAQDDPSQLPNLVPQVPTDIQVGRSDDGDENALRFTVATANRGPRPFDLLALDPDLDAGTARAAQCVQWSAPRDCAAREDIGEFIVHPDHGHVHFDDYALYELRSVLGDGQPDLSPEGLLATGGKVSFCLLDLMPDPTYGTFGPEYDDSFYFCGETPEGTLQGISPGWQDIYVADFPGQQILLDGVPDGSYAIVVTADPSGRIHETDDTDNVSFAGFVLSGGGTTVMETRRVAPEGSDDVRDLAIALCQEVSPQPDSGSTVVLARHDAFADALAGAALAGTNGCVLFTTGGPDAPLDPATREEIDRALYSGASVRILGGSQAVSTGAEQELRDAGYRIQRLQGETRYETAAVIAAQVREEFPFSTDAILASGVDFPDAVTGGAYSARTGIPVLLSEPGVLHPAAAKAFEELRVAHTLVLGGTAALSDAVLAAVPDPERIAGPNRMGTAAAIATTLWGRELGGDVPGVVLVNLERPDAWAAALAAAPLAAQRGAPQVGVGATYPPETATYLESLPAVSDLYVIGGPGFVTEEIAAQATADASA